MGSETSSFDKNTDTPQTQEQQKQAAIEKVLQDEKIQLKDLMSGIKIADSTINNMIKTWDQNVDYREQQFKKPGNDRNDKKNLDAWIKKMEDVVGEAKRIASAIKLVNNNPNDSNAKKINDFVDKYSLQIQDAKKLLATAPATTNPKRQNSVDDNSDKNSDTTDNNSENSDVVHNNIPAHTVYDRYFGSVLEMARSNKYAQMVYDGFKQFGEDVAIRMVITCFYESSFKPDARNGSHYGLMQVAGLHGFKNLYDPQTNINAAIQIYKEALVIHKRHGQAAGFMPWQAATSRGLQYSKAA